MPQQKWKAEHQVRKDYYYALRSHGISLARYYIFLELIILIFFPISLFFNGNIYLMNALALCFRSTELVWIYTFIAKE